MPLNLYNTLSRKVEPLNPADPGRVTFYSCGPTVYDDAHIGNFRSFLAADVLRRWIESPLCELAGDRRPASDRAQGRKVVQVMNITDVGHMTDDAEGGEQGEDRMMVAGRRFAEAKKAGKLPADAEIDPADPYAIAEFYAGRFREDARMLGLRVALEADADPTLMPRATANVSGMIAMVARLVDMGCAYVRGEPGSRVVYFDVQRFASYGRLSGNTLEDLRGGAGGRVADEHQAQKKHPADFLLWKEDPRHIMKWDSPWGPGYPGWHIECSVMSLDRLVTGGLQRVLTSPWSAVEIDLHSGGEDNIFPHHECERAQSCAITGGQRFSRHWFHARFLLVEGEKMSKSKGNFFTARDLFAKGHEPAAVRLELIKTHYRANANFTEQGLKDSARMVERWRKVADTGDASTQAGERPEAFLRDFASAMNEDLNIAGAIGAVNGWINSISEPTRADAEAMRLIDGVLGVLGLARAAAQHTEIGVFVGVEPSPEIEALLAQRRDAKKAKDFARADAIRNELAAKGLAIKDVAGGKVEVSRV
ncbi:MAG: cysteine--tRNA ligase [Phycisphaerales bacterium]|nr:cysteine--tRNA ligase [Phycisphaerales bacterium]